MTKGEQPPNLGQALADLPRTKRKYSKGEVILHQGDPLTEVCFIRKGYVKAYTISEESEERLLVFFKTGSVFPLHENYRAGYKMRLYYEAFTNCSLEIMSRSHVANLLRSSKEVKLAALEGFVDLATELMERMSLIENKNAAGKVTRLLPYLVEVFGKPVKKDTYRLVAKITHQDIANMTGLARETVSIHLKELEKGGCVLQSRGQLIIHANKLQAFETNMLDPA